MTLRRRLALLSAAAVALTVVLASAITYFTVRDNLRGQIDDDLREFASRAERLVGGGPGGVPIPLPPDAQPLPGNAQPPRGSEQPLPGAEGPPTEPGRAGHGRDVLTLPAAPDPGGPPTLGRLILPDGEVIEAPGSALSEFTIPVSDEAGRIASGDGEARFEDVDAGGTSVRVLTEPLPQGGALQVARSLEDTNDTLGTLLVVLFVVSAGGIALAAGLGLVVARTALAPAGEVSDAAVEVARTHDLTRRIEVRGDDELGRLAASFNEMMQALQRSEAAQRRLVADASHELRTPLATLRTNIETLARGESLEPSERARLVEDLTDELEEMTGLVSDVVELAREPGANQVAPADVRLDELTHDAVERARRRARGLSFSEQLSPILVRGDPARIGRAISNLLDNAAKWSPEGGTVEVSCKQGRVAVRDHGPGFAADELPRVFDRFWRSDEARGTPGSGLGLAIVERVAEEHGGSASAANAEGGGALVELRLPPQPLPTHPQEDS